MHGHYLRKIAVGFILIVLSGVNGFYFLVTGQDLSVTNSNSDQIDLPINFLEKTIIHLTLASEELEPLITPYDHLIKVACRKHALNPALIKAIIHAESHFDPLAVSPKGAIGLMQLAPKTVKELGIKDPFNPKYNIDGGVRYLKDLLDAFEGDQKLALAAYNAGPTQVYRHNGVPPFQDTEKYLKRVFRYIAYYQKTGIS
jgi:hypothetical protein